MIMQNCDPLTFHLNAVGSNQDIHLWGYVMGIDGCFWLISCPAVGSGSRTAAVASRTVPPPCSPCLPAHLASVIAHS